MLTVRSGCVSTGSENCGAALPISGEAMIPLSGEWRMPMPSTTASATNTPSGTRKRFTYAFPGTALAAAPAVTRTLR